MPSSNFNPDSLPSLKGKVFLVTGGNTGCGKATVAGLAGHGAKVYMGARSQAKALASISDIRAKFPDADVEFLHIDHTRLETVVAAADELRRKETSLHGLVNNAGIMGVKFEMTADGYESQLQTNYIAHWLLTYHLLPLLTATARTAAKPGDVRIVNVSSDGHSRFPPKEGIRFSDVNLESESPMVRYGQSKLANILHAYVLHEKFGPARGEGASSTVPGELWVSSVHPGHIDTNLNKQVTGSGASPGVLRTVTRIMRCLGVLDEESKGAWSSLFAVASLGFNGAQSGPAYIVPYAKLGTPSSLARDRELAIRLWNWTEKEMQAKGLLAPLEGSS